MPDGPLTGGEVPDLHLDPTAPLPDSFTLFAEWVGDAYMGGVQTLRVEEAKQMLETTDMPIDQVAAEIDDSEPSNIRYAFRRYVGLSASAYRRKWHGIGL